MEDCKDAPYSEEYYDLLVSYLRLENEYLPEDCIQNIDKDFNVVYLQSAGLPKLDIDQYTYSAIPKCFTTLDEEALQAGGIIRVQSQPNLALRGQGVLIGFVDTGIDYPVLQSEQENGEFYLKRNYKKEYDINGSLFLQADCKVSESWNLIIYGHNMNSGAMFGNLDLYAGEDYYNAHRFAYLQTEDGIQEYRIVTVLKADRDLFPFQQKLPDAAAVQEYLKAARQREVFETGDDYLKCIYDKVLTLITCSYEWNGARNIVLAVPVSGAVWSQKCS